MRPTRLLALIGILAFLVHAPSSSNSLSNVSLLNEPTKTASGVRTQQGGKLVGSDALEAALQSVSANLSADGSTALVGGHLESGNAGAASAFTASGTASFGPKTDFGTGFAPPSVALGDFNGDGKLDLAVAHFNGDSYVFILLGTGTGSFGASTNFDAGDHAKAVKVGDFNGDDKLDLAVAHDNDVSILLGTGTGSFGPKTDFGTGTGTRSVAVGDFNGDGKLDLAVANVNSDSISILPRD